MDDATLATLARIADALERLAPPPPAAPDLADADAYQWRPAGVLHPIQRVEHVDLAILQGIERQKSILIDNTMRFARGHDANNAMLWGARGMGKSSLVKAAHAAALAAETRLKLIEIERSDIETLPRLLDLLRGRPERCIVFCDDLSFEQQDTDYKALKSVLDGGIAGRPANVLFYATSNRRHLMPRDMAENERAAIHQGEATEEKISLSDRFGLWIGFHGCDQPTFLAIVSAYARAKGLAIAPEALQAQALEWSVTRGARSGRVAYQFIQDLSGRLAA